MSTKNTMYDTQPVTKSTAQANNMYLCVTNQTPGQLIQFLKQYTKPQLYVTTCSGIDILLDTQYAYLNFPYTSYTVFDPSTGKQMHNLCTVEQVINMMLRPPMQLKEISNDKVSVFLDEINLNYYKNLADEILHTYGNNRLPDQTMTGQQFFDRINELIQVANDIMDKKLVPDLFQCIPLKKNGTFQADRKIILYQNNCNYIHQMDALEYPSALKLVLCIVPHDTLEYEQVYDLVEPVHEKRARVAIVFMDAPRKLFALLDSNKQVQDIVTKATYLKDNQVLAGNIYRTKSGTEFLYIGCCDIISIYEENLESYLPQKTQQP